ncbi:MAG: hypothetical protein COV10_03390 [Candidatus Vogelbacteria bacterium CG10_big_fil_rev_8_21_14_0_10_51_16]|uniref:Inositol monophosphatase n=1 Tax=Candidatus Vogelbacteria bacterium CG10_big_fil_rev_8_21_14_0_10_51_16 TaxID=1975045 RepID=A0A2H0RDT4_9BACT|nr:MAG: hypothetical protein COV10_03390 [Candidatus Vogelbacteria bacterium CG10_big_fil_rev_8_21_14_0_10_51_16]
MIEKQAGYTAFTMETYLKFAKELAVDAGEIALRYFSFTTETTWKEDNTPLTKADTEINYLVVKRISEVYPDHSIYGEEKSVIKEGSSYTWVCDPIDGTMPFSLGLPMFTFSLALVEQETGQPVLGVVYDPIMKNMYWATKGGGAYRNGSQIFVSKQDNFLNAYVSAEGSGRHLGFSNLPLLDALSREKCKVMKLLSVIYGGVQVANGKFVGTVFYGEYAHDVATLKIITEEAGGKVTDLQGNERRYDKEGLGCVISNGYVHDKLLELIKKGKG